MDLSAVIRVLSEITDYLDSNCNEQNENWSQISEIRNLIKNIELKDEK